MKLFNNEPFMILLSRTIIQDYFLKKKIEKVEMKKNKQKNNTKCARKKPT